MTDDAAGRPSALEDSDSVPARRISTSSASKEARRISTSSTSKEAQRLSTSSTSKEAKRLSTSSKSKEESSPSRPSTQEGSEECEPCLSSQEASEEINIEDGMSRQSSEDTKHDASGAAHFRELSSAEFENSIQPTRLAPGTDGTLSRISENDRTGPPQQQMEMGCSTDGRGVLWVIAEPHPVLYIGDRVELPKAACPVKDRCLVDLDGRGCSYLVQRLDDKRRVNRYARARVNLLRGAQSEDTARIANYFEAVTELEFEKAAELNRELLLRDSVAYVALISRDDDDILEDLPSFLTCTLQSSFIFQGAPRHLKLVAIKEVYDMQGEEVMATSNSAPSQAEQISQIYSGIFGMGLFDEDDLLIWPIHEDLLLQGAIQVRDWEFNMYELLPQMTNVPKRRLLMILHWLRVIVHNQDTACSEKQPLQGKEPNQLGILRDRFGPQVEFLFSWKTIYIQHLWALTVFCIFQLILGVEPTGGGGAARVEFEVCKGLITLWAAAVAVRGYIRYHHFEQSSTFQKAHTTRKQLMFRQDGRKFQDDFKNKLYLFFAAIPLIFLLCFIIVLVMVGITNLILHIIWIWGDCINQPFGTCRDAEGEHGIFGWAAEVGCDILLALLFELFFFFTDMLARWVTSLQHFDCKEDMELSNMMLKLCISCIERVGFVGTLAFVFVPEWNPPPEFYPVEFDCSSLYILGESDIRCLNRKLPVETRRWQFKSLLKGPFVVAPFVSIIIKVLVPALVDKLEKLETTRCGYMMCCRPFKFLIRILSLVFLRDGPNVGCFNYVPLGMQCSNIELHMESGTGRKLQNLEENEEDIERTKACLQEMGKKAFEPQDELLEFMMSFLWTVLFTPVMPIGVIPTLGSQLCEMHSDMSKLLFVRRRPFPGSAKVLKQEVVSFMIGGVVGSCAWSVALSIVTYNNELYKWEFKRVMAGLLVFWIVGSAAFSFKIHSLSKARGRLCSSMFLRRPSSTEESRVTKVASTIRKSRFSKMAAEYAAEVVQNVSSKDKKKTQDTE